MSGSRAAKRQRCVPCMATTDPTVSRCLLLLSWKMLSSGKLELLTAWGSFTVSVGYWGRLDPIWRRTRTSGCTFVDYLDPCQLFAVSGLEGAPGTCSKYAEPAHLCSVLFGLQHGRVSRTKCCAKVGNTSLKPQGSQVKLKFQSICSLGNF